VNKRSFYRPIWGTIALQPLAWCWCLVSDLDYWHTVGPMTIAATIYLMPIYHWYEQFWDNQEQSISIKTEES
jgi:hypothetical protein